MNRKRSSFLVVVGIALVDIWLQSLLRGRWGVVNTWGNAGLVFLFWLMVLGIGWKEKKEWWYCLLIGGGVNLWFRWWGWGVWDYIKMPIIDLWFNLSDVIITLGVVMLLYGNGVANIVGRFSGVGDKQTSRSSGE